MAGALRKTMLYLGLADDRAEHEDYVDDYDDGEVAVPTEYEAQVTPLHRPTRSAVPETRATTAWGTPALDLPAGVVAVLGRAGVVHVVSHARDTWQDPALFSYRRAQRTGRFAGVVRPAPGDRW